MGVLTDELPKPLLPVAGKSLLEHKLDVLPETVDEVVVVVGYQETRIRERLGDAYGPLKLTYVTQETLDGTAGALWQAAPHLPDRFLVMMGDDLYVREDIERCIGTPGWAVLVSVRNETGAGGRVVVEDGQAISVEEGVFPAGELANTNAFVLDARIFDHHLIPKSAGSPEYGLPQTVIEAARSAAIPLKALPTEKWFQVTAPEDLARAEAWLAGTMDA